MVETQKVQLLLISSNLDTQVSRVLFKRCLGVEIKIFMHVSLGPYFLITFFHCSFEQRAMFGICAHLSDSSDHIEQPDVTVNNPYFCCSGTSLEVG